MLLTIGQALPDGEREIKVTETDSGREYVAYGNVDASGETYSLNHAPTQEDFARVAEELDSTAASSLAALLAR